MEIDKSEIYRKYIHRRDRQAIISSIIPDLYNSDESFKANDDKFIKEVDEKGLWHVLSNYLNNVFNGKKIGQRLIVEHFAKLYWGLNWAKFNKNDNSVEKLGNRGEYIYIPKDLSDEDKLLCAIFNAGEEDIVNSKTLQTLFDWTQYKCSKLVKEIPYVNTESCICDEGGYGGKSWVIDYKFMEEIENYQIRHHRVCAECANVSRQGKDNIFKCPISKEYIDPYKVSNVYCKFQKLEINKGFTDFWNYFK